MISIAKLLPGELDGNIDPEAYGFVVIREDPPTDEEAAIRIGIFYAGTKEITGVVIPKLEPYLAHVPPHLLPRANGNHDRQEPAPNGGQQA